MSDFPFNLLKAETLRAICRDLGFRGFRRDMMLQFLTTIQEQGLDEALKIDHVSSSQKAVDETPVSPASAAPTSSPSKRRLGTVVSDYDTRHKDKRVRVSDPGPGLRKRGRPPKPKPAPREPKRRGRPPKNTLKDITERKPHSQSSQKEIFDGVELPRFAKGKRKMQEETEGVAEDGLEASSDDLPEHNGDASSLASSNKENHVEKAETTVPNADEDADAEGEDEIVAASHQTAIQLVEVNNPMPDALVDVERVLQLAVENVLP